LKTNGIAGGRTQVASHEFWVTAGTSMGLGGVVGPIRTVNVALVRHRGSMSSLIDAQIRILIESYERRIAELKDKILRLESKIDAMTITCGQCNYFRSHRKEGHDLCRCLRARRYRRIGHPNVKPRGLEPYTHIEVSTEPAERFRPEPEAPPEKFAPIRRREPCRAAPRRSIRRRYFALPPAPPQARFSRRRGR
jgi:hypothetical protein